MEEKYVDHKILNYILDSVNPRLLDHVSFKKELIKLMRFIYATVDRSTPIIPFISDNEVALSNSGEVRKEAALGDNKLVVRGSITIEEDKTLTANKISGIIYDNEGECNSVLYTYYMQENINKFGVSLAKVTFIDEYFMEDKRVDIPIKELVFSTVHRPILREGKLIDLPKRYMDGAISYVYRDYNNPGLIYVDITQNIREDNKEKPIVSRKVYLSNPRDLKELDYLIDPVAIYDEKTNNFIKVDNVEDQ